VDLTHKQIHHIIEEELESVLSEIKCWDGYVRNRKVAKGKTGSCKKKTDESERDGHVERSCHQGLRNVTSGEDCDRVNETELDEKRKKKRKKAGTESSKESSLRDWFGRKGAKGKKKGWVDCNAPDGKGGYKSCGRSKGEKRKKYPACRPTPGACKERGKGKSWGKKGSKRKKKK
tara:strand:- start:748 stop:1272 length:525 start_codon:yes stop_codon:yes gene_type:complete